MKHPMRAFSLLHLLVWNCFTHWYSHSGNAIIGLVDAARVRKKHGNPNARSLRVINRSGSKIDVFWVHSVTGVLSASQTSGDGIFFGSETGISSYIGHAFEIHELPKERTKQCRNKQPCRTAHFVCNSNDDQWVTIDRNFSVLLQDSKSRALDKAKLVLQNCTNATDLKATNDANGAPNAKQIQQQIEQMTACFLQQTQAALNQTSDEIDFQGAIRQQMGAKLGRYSCDDTEFIREVRVTTSPSITNTSYALDSKTNLLVQTLFASDTNRIRLYPDLVSDDECRSILDNATVPLSLRHKVQRLWNIELPLRKGGGGGGTQSFSVPTLTVHRLDSERERGSCDVQADGSCLEPDTAPTPIQEASRLFQDDGDHPPAVRVLLTCLANSTVSNKTVSNETVPTRYNSSRGLLIVPHTGVRVVATHRAAVVMEYQDLSAAKASKDATSQDDTFLIPHLICPGSKDDETQVAMVQGVYRP